MHFVSEFLTFKKTNYPFCGQILLSMPVGFLTPILKNMKNSTLAFFGLIIFIIPSKSFGQNLDDLFPFAHYPLINIAEDALGFQNPMLLSNTVYEGQDGVYFNGLHPVVDIGGSSARTFYMDAMSGAKFAVQLDFRLDVIDDQVRCITVCGLNEHYLGFFIFPSGDFAILTDNHITMEVQGVVPQENRWYTYTMIYDTVTSLALFYLDGQEIESFGQGLNIPQGEEFVTNYYPFAGYPLKGNWRNLRIYGENEITSLENEFNLTSELNLFPNPSANQLFFKTSLPNATQWRVSTIHGDAISSGIVTEAEGEINISLFSPGVYMFNLLDQEGQLLARRKFVKG